MYNGVALLIVAPFAGAALGLLAAVFHLDRVARAVPFVSLVGTGLLLLAIFLEAGGAISIRYAFGAWEAPVGIELRMDGAAAIMCAAGLVVSIFAYIASLSDRTLGGYFYFCYQLLVGGMLGMILADDLFNLFVFVEIVSISSFILIAYEGKPPALIASLKYLLISSLGLVLYLAGVLIVYKTCETLSLSNIDVSLTNGRFDVSLAAALLATGVCVKTALEVFLEFTGFGIRAHFSELRWSCAN